MKNNQTSPHDLTLEFYTLEQLRQLLEHRPQIRLHPDVVSKIQAGSEYVKEKAAEDRYIYGVNTGFGSLCETRINPGDMEKLQHNLLLSHSVGVGEIVSVQVSRLALFIKLLTFRSGHTGISLDVVNRMLDFWNNDVIPAIPKKGTVGASGDLAPLAHLALPLVGLGKVHFRGEIVAASVALEEMGWKPLRLKPKEGLALTNGVQYLDSMASESLMRVADLIKCADVLAALSSQAFSTSRTFYHKVYHATSWHTERHVVAANLNKLLDGSNHFALPSCNKSMQDPYSFRCIPQVHGAVRQAFDFAKNTIEKDMNGVGDNPLFFPEEDLILFGGNLHGESSAMAMDFLAIAVSELGNISERRTYQLLSGERGLPDFLVKESGLNSGFMITQYTSAALVNENKVLCTPACVDTIPTCQLQEDHVSMGGTSAYKLHQIIENCDYIFAIELLNAAQAIELNAGLQLSPVSKRIFDSFRQSIPFLETDKIMSDEIEKARLFFIENRREWATELGLD